MMLKDINFGDVDAKNEILKQSRISEDTFFNSFSIPDKISLEDIINGQKYFILGLKGTGKTALIRYLNDKCIRDGAVSELILFKSHISEEDRQNLSSSSGFQIITADDAPTFVQDFKEAWKWMIYQRIAILMKQANFECESALNLFKITGITRNNLISSMGSLLSNIKSGSVTLSAEALGVAISVGINDHPQGGKSKVSISEINRACALLLKRIKYKISIYLYFDELELFHQTPEQFDRDRRIIRDLAYAIAYINAESAEHSRKIFICSTLRTEVLHSVLELGHEIGRDIDDYGVRLDWSEGKDSEDHPLMNLIRRKISISTSVDESDVWSTFFPREINNQVFYKFILNSSYYRPRDIVRLLRVARDFRSSDLMFTTEHFDRTSTEYSKQTWLEVTEELLAGYSSVEIAALQRILLGFRTHFFKNDLHDRIKTRYRDDRPIQSLLLNHDLTKILGDLFRIGVIGNDFVAVDRRGARKVRQRWIFRGNTTLNDSERMAFHKSLWKHLSLVEDYK